MEESLSPSSAPSSEISADLPEALHVPTQPAGGGFMLAIGAAALALFVSSMG
jgi:hypothetical protein